MGEGQKDSKIKWFRQQMVGEEKKPYRQRSVPPAGHICQSQTQRCVINSHGARTNGPSIPPRDAHLRETKRDKSAQSEV